MFALSRYGGPRCPSESPGLRWDGIDRQRSRFTVHSPKTEHHVGGESRIVPIFPELLPCAHAHRVERRGTLRTANPTSSESTRTCACAQK